jgi:predicted Rossmann fold nucleotide-binding protein DprA/Smf involved in DNA uptake
MKKITTQLKTLSKSLDMLSKKVEKIIQDVDKVKAPKKAAPAKKTVVKKAVAKKAATKKTAAKKTVSKKAAPAQQVTMLDNVFDIIKRTKKGVTVAQLKEKTQLNSRQLSNALYKLTKKGKIQTKSRGLYVKK